MTTRGLSFCIPIDVPETGGGGFRFVRNFQRYLDANRMPHTRRASAGCTVLLLNAWHVRWATALLAAWAEPNVTIIHRVDGAAADYGRAPGVDAVQRLVNRLADLTIFQSEYSRYATRTKFRVIQGDGPVIHNPVDLEAFTPAGPRLDIGQPGRPRACAVTWSTNARKGAAAVYRAASMRPDVDFVLCGRFEAAPSLPNLFSFGVLDTDRLAATMRSCDLLVTFSENEACPNVVLEALASGLPVLYLDSGATSELVADCGIAITPASFGAGVDAVMRSRRELAHRARQRAELLFAPSTVFAKYISAAREAALLRPRKRRLERMADLLLAMRRGQR